MKIKIVLTLFWGLATIIVANFSQHFYWTRLSGLSGFLGLTLMGVQVSILSCFWVFVLTDKNMIFGWYRRMLTGFAESYNIKDGKTDSNRYAISEDLLKPILTCEICVGANVAFWSYVAMSRKEFVLLDLLFVVSLTGLVTLLTTKQWQKITN